MTKFRSIEENGKIAPWVTDLAGKSGVYVIREPGIFGGALYVGESHTGRLYSTLLRHFQHWKGKTAGPTYKREAVVVAVEITDSDKAIEMQNDAIGFLWPRDNIKENPAQLEQ
jgi:hypothetical protein